MLCAGAIKTIEKNGLDSMAREAGVDLWKLPFQDARPERLQYLAENPRKVPVAVNPRCALLQPAAVVHRAHSLHAVCYLCIVSMLHAVL
jgi:hypothetical protein